VGSDLPLRLVSTLITSVLTLILSVCLVSANPLSAKVSKLLPKKIGAFQQATAVRPLQSLFNERPVSSDLFEVSETRTPGFIGGEVEYRAENGKRFLVELARFRRDSDAYSLLTIIAAATRTETGADDVLLDVQVGTASIRSQNGIAFFKGPTFVRVSSKELNGSSDALELARQLAESLERGDGEIPVLVLHLPDWQNAQKKVLYLSGFRSLQSVASDQPVLAALDSVRDADAVIAEYGQAKLIVIEFNTPQLAGDYDRLIVSKIRDLQAQNQPRPTSYRRVGNYGVFVFNASSEQAANELINQIQYEQVVQWLGDNPYWLKEAQRRYTETTLGVLIAVVKASGLTLVGCFGLGGLIGAILFASRRKRQATTQAFSDAGGMLRLNLDEMTPQTDSTRLLAGRNQV
jgi:hypothetical protein